MKENIKQGSNAFDLFPDVFEPEVEVEDLEIILDAALSFDTPLPKAESNTTTVSAPEPPDTSWLPQGVQLGANESGNIPRQGLIYIASAGKRALVTAKVQELGFTACEATDCDGAIEEFKRSPFSLVICDFEEESAAFHEYMRWLPMNKRRLIYYTLIGTNLRTMYNLEALALSANMVVCDQDLHHLTKILDKGFAEYERLFGPLMEEMQIRAPLIGI